MYKNKIHNWKQFESKNRIFLLTPLKILILKTGKVRAGASHPHAPTRVPFYLTADIQMLFGASWVILLLPNTYT